MSPTPSPPAFTLPPPPSPTIPSVLHNFCLNALLFSSLRFFTLLFLLLADCQTPCPAFPNYTRRPALRTAAPPSLPTRHPPDHPFSFPLLCISSVRSCHASSRPRASSRFDLPDISFFHPSVSLSLASSTGSSPHHLLLPRRHPK